MFSYWGRKINTSNIPSVPKGEFRLNTPRTNFDVVTESPEKLAEFLKRLYPDSDWLDWLKQPAEEDA